MSEDRRALAGELQSLVRAVRAHVEWQAELGTAGLTSAKRPPAKAAALAPARAAAGPARQPAQPPASRSVPQPVSREASPPSPAPSGSPVFAAAAPADRAAQKRRLIELAEEIRPCTRCALHSERKQTVFARGNPAAELCFVGEGPGADEDAQGEPFVGKAGQLLDKMIAAMGYQRDEVYICNIVKCRPPNNRKPEPSEMTACSPYLTEQLSLVAPRAIVLLGATAVEGLLGGGFGGITRLRGQWKLYQGTIPVMPTFHPAYLLRNPPAKREVWSDLQAVMKHLGRPIPPATSAR